MMAKVAAATVATLLVTSAPSAVLGDGASTTGLTSLHELNVLPGLERHPALHPYVPYVPPAPIRNVLSAPVAPIPIPVSTGVDSLSSAPDFVQAFAACVRQHENGWAGYTWGYPAGTGDGGGAYQFMPGTWATANQLDGGNVDDVSPTNQDNAFVAIYNAEGTSPWAGDGCA